MIEPHRHDGVFVARGKEDALVTLNFVPGSEVYGEKRISVEVSVARSGKTFIRKCDEKRRGRTQCYDFEEAKPTDSRRSLTPKVTRLLLRKSTASRHF